jgi:Ca2+-binding RTX toxin-like protein
MGLRATLVGTRRADVLRGTPRPDVILAHGGDDRVIARGGRDLVCGGGGDDTVDLGGGADHAAGGAGQDLVLPGPGDDRVTGGRGFLDLVFMGTAAGPVDVDLVRGRATGQGVDRIRGVEGAVGSQHDDSLRGAAPFSVLAGLGGDDQVRGGSGVDVVLPVVAPAVTVDLGAGEMTGEGVDAVTGVEVVFGTEGPDLFAGSTGSDTFVGLGGTDDLRGVEGGDVLMGGPGTDLLAGGPGDDVLRGDDAAPFADALDGGPGADLADWAAASSPVTVDLAAGTGAGGDSLRSIENLGGSAQGDVLRGDSAGNVILGRGGADEVDAGAGNDTVLAGAGSDTVLGGLGDDHLIGEAGGGAASGGPGQDVCLEFTSVQECEDGLPVGDGDAPRQANRPVIDWVEPGNPAVLCTGSAVLAGTPARVRPDPSLARPQRVWVRQELYHVSDRQTVLQWSPFFYTELDTSQWSTRNWYLYEGDGSDPLDNWTTTFNVGVSDSLIAYYHLWWEDIATGQFIAEEYAWPWHGRTDGVSTEYREACYSPYITVGTSPYWQCPSSYTFEMCDWLLVTMGSAHNSWSWPHVGRPSVRTRGTGPESTGGRAVGAGGGPFVTDPPHLGTRR